jgi:PadR family transcriptional regulator PadR
MGAAGAGEDVTMADAGPKLLRGLLEVFMLESLEQAPKHGYALLKEVTEAFGAEPNRNRLYPLLARMVKDGYIREMNESGGNRTLYTLTDAGRDALRSYRRLPPQFRHALRRIWNVDAPHAHDAPPSGEAPPRVVPVLAPGARAASPSADALPYPCPDARVAAEKDPRTGDLTLRLTGCPMGAYEHCPKCPVSQALAGLRGLLLPP